MILILPIAGKSTRFENLRPKWMLTNPSGNFMLIDSILGLNLNKFNRIIIPYVKKHEEQYSFKEGLLRCFKKYDLQEKVELLELEDFTKDQVETIELALKLVNANEPFLIKDSDNYFEFDSSYDENIVCYGSLEENKNIESPSKSYITVDDQNLVSNIIEKKVISDKFCCGGYYFLSKEEFLKNSNLNLESRYISHVIFNMMLNNHKFRAEQSFKFCDWGTKKDWVNYKSKFATIFLDLDGVVFKNSSHLLPPYIEDAEPLNKNIQKIKQLQDSNKVEFVITTSRPEEYREITESQLKRQDIKYKQLIMGLQHNQRIIINDFSNSNPYKSCEAINIERNKDNLNEYLDLI